MDLNEQQAELIHVLIDIIDGMYAAMSRIISEKELAQFLELKEIKRAANMREALERGRDGQLDKS